MNISDPKDVFRQEAQDLLAQLEAVLLDLEHRPDDIELIDSAFRALHTIKGSGSMFGFEAVAAFTHHVETAFDRVRKGSLKANRDLIATALTARDHMRLLIEEPAAANPAARRDVRSGVRRDTRDERRAAATARLGLRGATTRRLTVPPPRARVCVVVVVVP